MDVKKVKQGFTIVELLIVVVVIAILAGISIAAYSGIQQRAKTSLSLSTVVTVKQKASAWAATTGSYPDLAQLRTNSMQPTSMDTPGGDVGPIYAKLDDSNIVIGATMNQERSGGGKVVTYEPCWDGTMHAGAKITLWNFSSKSEEVSTVGKC